MPVYAVARADEIPLGGRKIVEVAGRSIGVFNVEGSYFAIRNRCPHQGGPLCQGVLSGFAEAPEPGVYRYTRKGEFLRCPWHGWEFEVKTGQSWFDPGRMRVRRYEVEVQRGEQLLAGGDGAATGRRPGPYVAETYPILVHEQYILVRIDA
ncbi:MAG TPA: Rieske 2Fe-2S domain-containing protein [Chloroflexota bacterium]|nr:Rieske 2Fe-2S domain-containing protein [Chloroflexota bacterium]